MADKKKKASNSSMRLDKFLVEMGKGTRSQIKEMAKKGRIQVNGAVLKATDEKIGKVFLRQFLKSRYNNCIRISENLFLI